MKNILDGVSELLPEEIYDKLIDIINNTPGGSWTKKKTNALEKMINNLDIFEKSVRKHEKMCREYFRKE